MSGWACVARLGGLGDNLIAASTLRPLKRLGYMIEVITAEPMQVVFRNNPHIDKLTVKQEGDIPGGADWQKWFASRAKEYELFAHLSHSCEYRHGLMVDQTAFWYNADARRKLCAGSYLETAHDIVGVPYEFGPLFFPTDEERERAREDKLKQNGPRCVTWVISGSRLDKYHPYSALIISRIIKELGVPVVMVGVGGQQGERATQISDVVKVQNGTTDGLHIVITVDGTQPGGDRNWPIRRSLAQSMQGDLVISPDTGMAWAMAFEEMPKVIMVSHASPENITKHWRNTVTLHGDPRAVPCWPCHRLHNDISTCVPDAAAKMGAACITNIKVDTVVEAARRALKSTWQTRGRKPNSDSIDGSTSKPAES